MTGAERRTVAPGGLEPGAEVVVNGRRLTVAMVVPARTGFAIAPTCGAPVLHDPAVDEPITWQEGPTGPDGR